MEKVLEAAVEANNDVPADLFEITTKLVSKGTDLADVLGRGSPVRGYKCVAFDIAEDFVHEALIAFLVSKNLLSNQFIGNFRRPEEVVQVALSQHKFF